MLLSNTYHPSPALAPYIRRYYVFEANLPDAMVIEDFLLAETAMVRCLIRGEWVGEIEPGQWSQPGKTLFFGANALPLKVRVKGSFAVAGFAIRPSGWKALFDQPHTDFADNVLLLQDVWGELADTMQRDVERATDDTGKVEAMEAAIANRLADINRPEIDEAMARFERIARIDSTKRIEDAAHEIGLSVRQLERRCTYSFGLTPKAILRRSRFLDMATAMRGFSTPSEQDLASLRYYDQSHVTREFRRFTHMTPTQFQATMTPLQTAGLKMRQEALYED